MLVIAYSYLLFLLESDSVVCLSRNLYINSFRLSSLLACNYLQYSFWSFFSKVSTYVHFFILHFYNLSLLSFFSWSAYSRQILQSMNGFQSSVWKAWPWAHWVTCLALYFPSITWGPLKDLSSSNILRFYWKSFQKQGASN